MQKSDGQKTLTDKCIEYVAHGACDVSIKCRGMNKAAIPERRRRRQYSAVSDALNEHAPTNVRNDLYTSVTQRRRRFLIRIQPAGTCPPAF